MNLLMISGDRSLPSGKQGAFFSMLQEFSRHWDRIDIICPRVAGAALTTLPELPNVFIHSSPTSLLSQPFFIKTKGKELFDDYQHDVMTVHDYPPFYNGIGARMLKNVIHIPAVLEIHHLVGRPIPASFTEALGRVMTSLFLPSHIHAFNAVRTVNSGVKEALVQWGIAPDRVQIVPSFYLNTSIVKQDPSAQKKYDLVFSARLVANKGLMMLLDALLTLPDVTLLVSGDGPQKKTAMQHVSKCGLSSRVTFTGWLKTEKDVADAMRSGRIFVMCSLSEGGPRSALEAMACGVPVIATRVGVMPDVIDDGMNGVLTDSSMPALASAIKSLLANRELQVSMGNEAAKIVERFERTRLIKEYADFLKSFVE